MSNEILNISYHRKRLMLMALNRIESRKKQAEALGISERCLYFWMNEYKIKFCHQRNQFISLINNTNNG